MNDLEIGFNTFENIKIIDKNGNEFWYARELMIALEYKRWDKFTNVIKAAETACEQSNNSVNNHFSQVEKMVTIGSNACIFILFGLEAKFAPAFINSS